MPKRKKRKGKRRGKRRENIKMEKDNIINPVDRFKKDINEVRENFRKVFGF